jgi:hypothetical protein
VQVCPGTCVLGGNSTPLARHPGQRGFATPGRPWLSLLAPKWILGHLVAWRLGTSRTSGTLSPPPKPPGLSAAPREWFPPSRGLATTDET